MAVFPTDGGSPGTWGAELRAYHAVSTDTATGKIKDGAVFQTSAAPTVDAGVANKKYVDDSAVTETTITSGGLTGTLGTGTASFSKVITHPGGMIEIIGYLKEAGASTIDISSASFTGIYTCQLTSYDTTDNASDRTIYLKALTLTQITWEIGTTDTELIGVFYHVIGY